MNTIFPDIHPRALKPPLKPEQLLESLRSDIPLKSPHEISLFVQNAEYDLDLYDKLIHHIQSKQAALRRDITRYTSLKTPIRKLPNEVLRRIFGLATGRSQFGESCFDRKSTVFRLSSVSSRWREITLNAPELWADMYIYMGSNSILPVQLSLSRSQQHPLSLQLAGNWNEEEDRLEESAVELFRLLLEHHHRWQCLNCVQRYAFKIAGFYPLIRIQRLPLLESVRVCPMSLDCIPLNNSPNLCHIEYMPDPQYEDYNHDLPYDEISWSSLRQLDIIHCDLQPVLECLRRGRALRLFTYSYPDHREYESLPQLQDRDRIVSSLKTIFLDLSNPPVFHAVLHDVIQSITLPSLDALTISCKAHYYFEHFRDFGGEWPRYALRDFLERSRCSLTTLTLSGVPLEDCKIVSLLHLTPTLHTLNLYELWSTDQYHDISRPKPPEKHHLHRTVTKTLLKRLGATPSTVNAFSFQYPILPKLKSLTLRVESHFDADEAFIDLVKSRWIRPVPDALSSGGEIEILRTVVLHVFNRKLVKEIYEPLKKIEKLGMMISVYGDKERVI